MVNKKYTVCVDPGHGGSDPGAVGPNGVQEKVITLAVAQKVASILCNAGLDVKLTRDVDKLLADDINSDLGMRCKIANRNKADVFVSIHCNSATNGTARGAEVYTSRGNTKSDALATAIISSIEKALPELIFRKDFSDGDPDKEAGYAVLNNTNMPAVLVELAFISNPVEEGLLESPDFQQKAAQAIADGVADFLGVKLVVAKPTDNAPRIRVGKTELNGIIVDGTIYAPARALVEALGHKVNWDAGSKVGIVE